MGKLSGIRVVDLTRYLPGPMLTLMMADQGAEVMKVEPPGGDPTRAQAPFEAGQSIWFRNLNRGKRSVALDLKTESGREALWLLIEEADVLVEGFRPGVSARLGFDYQTVSTRNPRIVYCSISAFGQQTRLAGHPAHDLAVQAMTGFLAVNAGEDGVPVVPGAPSADMAAGLTALAGVLMALIGRERTGRGDYLDVAMFDALLPWCSHVVGEAIAGGEPPQSRNQRSLGGAAFYNVYRTADQRFIVLAGRESKFVTHLLTALGRVDLIPFATEPEGDPQAPLIRYLRDTFSRRTRDEWVGWFADKEVAFSPVVDFREALADPHVAERELLVRSDGAHQIAPALRFASEPRWSARPAPELGADG
jgi:crotonobetainyl-CoA:carnitine CoA-transferase CaiB-like acyl-CoA transferase